MSETVPDFASLYGDGHALTPRMVAHLWGAALFLADTYRSESQLDLLRQELPPVVQRLADDAWMRRFAAGFENLAVRLARAGFPYETLASCTAEEMALHLVIDVAEALVSDEILPVEEHLPGHGEADTDFDWPREVLFRDHDVLMLFNASLDGIEDESNEFQEQYHFANLHPRDWFVTFPDQGSP